MSYLALARKYRPRRFEEVRGQDHVVRALAHALDSDRLHPALLLTGTRGVGKTTLGRIIAKGLNCETGVSAHPCGECSACREVDEGRFIDLIEIDAASRTKVDDTRQLLDNVAYAPVRGRYKVYLIDEVHMLSNASFNALLKTLEEPPPHIKFILATTDPQKLPVTVLSRCLQFNLKRLPVALIREVLVAVLADEGKQGEAAALAALARAADGSMRDGLSLLDQAIAYCGDTVLQPDAIEEMLGTVGRRTLFNLIEAIADGDGDRLIVGLRALESSAPDYAALIDALAGALQRIAVLQILPQAQDEEDDPAMPTLAQKITPEDAQLYYQIAVHGRRDLPWAPDPRLGFEMTLLRMFAFRPESGKAAVGATPESTRGTRSAVSAPVDTVSRGVTPTPATVGIAVAEPAPAAAVTAVQNDTGNGWLRQVEALKLDGMAKQLARHCAILEEDATDIRLTLATRSRHLYSESRRTEMEQALAVVNGRPKSLHIEIVDTEVDSPARLDEQRIIQRQRDAETAIETDPAVRALRESLGASVLPGSVQPLD